MPILAAPRVARAHSRLGAALSAALGVAASLTGVGGALAADMPSAPAIEAPPPAYSYFLHLGPGGLFPSEGARFSTSGLPIPGTISIAPQASLLFEAGYYITPNVAVSLTGGAPLRADIYAAGPISGLGKLGVSVYGPVALTAHYHFTNFGRFQPYIGAGPTFLLSLRTEDRAVSQLKIDNSLGFVGQVGADFMINDRWGVFFDVKKAYLRTTSTSQLGVLPLKAKVTLDPLVLHTGLTYRF